MSRYINADELKKQAFQDYSPADVMSAIDHCPTADVTEVRHGRNVTDMHPVDEFICSECGLILRDLTETRIDEENEDECYFEFECNYCPHCGAKMDGDEK